jgi:hypothetical protein
MNMQYVNPRNQQYMNINPQLRRSLMPFVQQSNVPVNYNQNNPKKIKWGQPTWFLFHTLAEKVKDEHFSFIKNDLFNNIVSICNNLPCPKCTTHASEYMSKVNANSIRSKDDLKKMLFIFHNEVNTRTGAAQFSYEELNDKYSKAITIDIIQNFFVFFNDRSFNVTYITNNMHRARLMESLKNWFMRNIQYFDL